MNKIGEIRPKNALTMTVYYDEKAHTNPYRIFLEWMGDTGHGLAKRKKQVTRYADLSSCTAKMHEYATRNNEERR